MFRIIGKALGIVLVLAVNFAFWSYVERSMDSDEWDKLSRFLFMTANVYIIYKTILADDSQKPNEDNNDSN